MESTRIQFTASLFDTPIFKHKILDISLLSHFINYHVCVEKLIDCKRQNISAPTKTFHNLVC